MVEITKVSLANNSKSLRVTIPMSIVRQFEMDENYSLEWKLVTRNNKFVLEVMPIKGSK